MTRSTLPALASLGLLGAALVGTAAEPAPAPRPAPPSPTAGPSSSGISGAAYSGVTGRVGPTTPYARPRGAAFVSTLFPARGPVATLPAALAAAVPQVAGYDLVVYAPHRPLRVRVATLYQGKAVGERWVDALRTAYAGFDRDGDGYLNGTEVQFIFTDAALVALMQNGFYAPNPTDPPTLDKLDADGDRRVSFAEFAAYYKVSAAQVVRLFPPVPENGPNALATEALFKLFDRNGDGKLTRDEVALVEKLIATHDADEDECLSLAELVPNAGFDPRLARLPVQPARPVGSTVPDPALQPVAGYEIDRIPGTVTQKLFKQYDKDGDFELTREESGFDEATFVRLDTDGDGKLSGEELDLWRTGPPDLEVVLSLAPTPAECKAEVTTDSKTAAARGFTVSRMDPGRLIVRHGRQPLEFWAAAVTTGRNQRANLKQQWAGLFAQAAGSKGFVTEDDIGGQKAVQYQVLRVLFDPADFNADGKLTKEEFDRYFDLQQAFTDLSIGLTPTVQTPTLFQLLDENRDGRLGVRELRTAWARLAALEPTATGEPAEVVTKAAIQPAVSVRVSRVMERAFVNQQVNFVVVGNPNQIRVPQKGPLWFRKMDRNADGDVSRVEFLGTRAEFDAIDADHDGLISLEEAEAHDKAARVGDEKK